MRVPMLDILTGHFYLAENGNKVIYMIKPGPDTDNMVGLGRFRYQRARYNA